MEDKWSDVKWQQWISHSTHFDLSFGDIWLKANIRIIVHNWQFVRFTAEIQDDHTDVCDME